MKKMSCLLYRKVFDYVHRNLLYHALFPETSLMKIIVNFRMENLSDTENYIILQEAIEKNHDPDHIGNNSDNPVVN